MVNSIKENEIIFLDRSKSIHNNLYSYDLVNYVNALTKVEIICKTHGSFWQIPATHCRGTGCPKCSKYSKKSINEFKEKAIKIHNNFYDYTKTDFSKIINKSIITCPIHGDFIQSLDKHINSKHGCPKCGGSQKKTLEEFINEAQQIHGNLYDYILSVYLNFELKLEIICSKHGSFWQTPHNHIIGKQGCPTCVHRISKGELDWLNFIGLPNDNLHRNVYIKLFDRSIKADGYDSKINTVYEFYGDYYHGNPKFYNPTAVNPHTKCTFGELYSRTLEKEKSIKAAGINLVSIWEHEWNAL
jgi:hypothetical protein